MKKQVNALKCLLLSGWFSDGQSYQSPVPYLYFLLQPPDIKYKREFPVKLRFRSKRKNDNMERYLCLSRHPEIYILDLKSICMVKMYLKKKTNIHHIISLLYYELISHWYFVNRFYMVKKHGYCRFNSW